MYAIENLATRRNVWADGADCDMGINYAIWRTYAEAKEAARCFEIAHCGRYRVIMM